MTKNKAIGTAPTILQDDRRHKECRRSIRNRMRDPIG
jgi:hypothetical protein